MVPFLFVVRGGIRSVECVSFGIDAVEQGFGARERVRFTCRFFPIASKLLVLQEIPLEIKESFGAGIESACDFARYDTWVADQAFMNRVFCGWCYMKTIFRTFAAFHGENIPFFWLKVKKME